MGKPIHALTFLPSNILQPTDIQHTYLEAFAHTGIWLFSHFFTYKHTYMLTLFFECRTMKATITFSFLLLQYTLSFQDCQVSRMILVFNPTGRLSVPRLPLNPATKLLDIKLLLELVPLKQSSYLVDSRLLPFP